MLVCGTCVCVSLTMGSVQCTHVLGAIRGMCHLRLVITRPSPVNNNLPVVSITICYIVQQA